MDPFLRTTLIELSALINAHRDGLLRAYTPEDLHQFRVNTRRIRSLLKQLETWEAIAFSRAWREFFAATNPARDWDVFLQTTDDLLQDDHRQQVADSFSASLRESHQAAIQALESPRWDEHMIAWGRYLEQVENQEPPPRHEMLKNRLYKFEQARSRALASNRDHDWHKLRIALKNLRYVADSSLEPDHVADIGQQSLIEQCKRLQDLLGDWHDTTVQLRLLEDMSLDADTARKLGRGIRKRRRRFLSQARAELATNSIAGMEFRD